MSAQVFYHLAEHLALAHIDVSADDITVAPITSATPVAGIAVGANAYSVPTAQWLSAWTSYISTTEAMTSAITAGLTGSAYRLAITDLTFNTATDIDVYGLLFYKDSGSSATSPLLVVDIFDVMVSVEAGVDFPWTAPDYLVQMLAS